MTMPSGRTRGRPRSFNDTSQNTIIQSLDRAMGVLKIIATGGDMSLTEIAAASGQSTSTAYRILITLQRHRIVEFETAGQVWHIGPGAFQIGSAFLGRTSIVEQSRDAMQEIVQITGETANLAIIDGDEVIFVSQVETHHPIRAFFRPGTRGPIHASGIGKALLAFFDEARIKELIGKAPLQAFTDNTITDPARLHSELALIRQRGWAVDDEERTPGMRCIAAPIFNAAGEPMAGISASGPSLRVTPDKDAATGMCIREAAHAITAAIGGRPPRKIEGLI